MQQQPEIVTHDSILTTVKQRLRVHDTTDHDIWLLELIDRAARSISSTETVIMRNCEVEMNDNRFDMPADAKTIVAFRGDGQCIEGIFIDKNFFDSCGCNSPNTFPGVHNVFTQSGRTIYSQVEVTDGTKFDIAYRAVHRDSDGRMVTSEEQVEACEAFACWTFADSYPERYDRNSIQNWKRRWELQSGKSRSLGARRTFEKQRMAIRSRMNAIVSIDRPFGWLTSLFPTGFYYTNNP